MHGNCALSAPVTSTHTSSQPHGFFDSGWVRTQEFQKTLPNHTLNLL